MEDFNAKTGRHNTGYTEVMGKQRDELEWRKICGHLNNLVIGGSVYSHKRINKATWVSLEDGVTENQTDDFCITSCRKFRRSLWCLRVRRAADRA